MAHIQTQTEWEEEMGVKILTFIRSELYLDLRFFDVALSSLSFRTNDSLRSLATDGSSLYFSTTHLLPLFKANGKIINRIYLHSVLHCLFFHLWIKGNRDRHLWNLACDIAVEHTIDQMNLASIRQITSWHRQNLYQQLEEEKSSISAAVVYRKLITMETDKRLLLEREFYMDDHLYWPKEEQQQLQNPAYQQWNQIARKTQLSQQQKGDDPKEGEEVFAAQVKVERGRRSYREFLQKFSVLREELKSDPDEFDLNYYTYGLSLYHNMPLIEPVETKESRKIQEFVIVLDTSYSTSGELIHQFLKETFQILTQENSFFAKSKMRILQCDDQVQVDEEVNTQAELAALIHRFNIVGGGNTDFRPAFEYVEGLIRQGQLKNLSGLLYFTDGKGIYPKKKPEFKTAFLFLDEYDQQAIPAWAIRMQLEPEDFIEKREQ